MHADSMADFEKTMDEESRSTPCKAYITRFADRVIFADRVFPLFLGVAVVLAERSMMRSERGL